MRPPGIEFPLRPEIVRNPGSSGLFNQIEKIWLWKPEILTTILRAQKSIN